MRRIMSLVSPCVSLPRPGAALLMVIGIDIDDAISRAPAFLPR
jgi:hypothetical protein